MTETMDFTPEQKRLAEETLACGQYSLVVLSADGSMHTFRQKGVRDLRELLASGGLLRGAFVADRAVGKGAAALMILAGVKEVYTYVASAPAVEFLSRHGVKTTCMRTVPYIENRTADGMCPVEERCLRLETPEECLVQIDEFLTLTGK